MSPKVNPKPAKKKRVKGDKEANNNGETLLEEGDEGDENEVGDELDDIIPNSDPEGGKYQIRLQILSL